MDGCTARIVSYIIIDMEKQENCSHSMTKIKVVTAVCGCETTVIICVECNQELSKPKTEC